MMLKPKSFEDIVNDLSKLNINQYDNEYIVFIQSLLLNNNGYNYICYLDKAGFDFRQRNNYCLMMACKYGKLNIVKYLVNNNKLYINANQSYALRSAVIRGHYKMVKFLLKNGSLVTDAVICISISLLHHCNYKNHKIYRLLTLYRHYEKNKRNSVRKI